MSSPALRRLWTWSLPLALLAGCGGGGTAEAADPTAAAPAGTTATATASVSAATAAATAALPTSGSGLAAASDPAGARLNATPDATPTPLSAPVSAAVDAAASLPGSLQTSDRISAPVYADTRRLEAFQRLSTTLQAAGLNAPAQSAALDTAAAGHADYLALNRLPGGHTQDSTRPGFTGVEPSQRARNAGYAGSLSEVLATASPTLAPKACVDFLLNTVYHLAAMLQPWTELGTGYASAGDTHYCVLEQGTRSSALPAAGALSAYPAPGSTATATQFNLDTERPRPLGSLSIGPEVGAPIAVSLASTETQRLRELGAYAPRLLGMRLFANGSALPLVTIAEARIGGADVADAQMAPDVIVAVPRASLAARTEHQAEATVELRPGRVVKKMWRFTTN